MEQTKTTAQQEARLIEQLSALDGRFAAAFTLEDINMILENVNQGRDFLFGTTRDRNIEKATAEENAQLKGMLEQANSLIKSLNRQIDKLEARLRDAKVENLRIRVENANENDDEISLGNEDMELVLGLISEREGRR